MRYLVCLLLLPIACGGADFGGRGDKVDGIAGKPSAAPKKDQDAKLDEDGEGEDGGDGSGNGGDAGSPEEPATAPEVPQIPASEGLATIPGDVRPALERCFQSMGLTKLPKKAFENYKVIEKSAFAPYAKTAITDEPEDEDAPEPSIVIIKTPDNFGPVVGISFKLLNPLGYYCITGTSKSVFTDIDITQCKTAKVGSAIDVTMGTPIEHTTKVKC